MMFDHLAEITETVSHSDDFFGCDVAVLEWAANEIEEQRAEIERLTNDLRNCCRELLDEREQLREESMRIKETYGGGWTCSVCGSRIPTLNQQCTTCSDRVAIERLRNGTAWILTTEGGKIVEAEEPGGDDE